MIIRFNCKCLFEIVESYDEDTDTTQTYDQTFEKDDTVEVDLVDDKGETTDMQFANGDMLYGLKKELYEVVTE